LDDSTDSTEELCKRLSGDFKEKGFDIEHLHRTGRVGFKAGALKEGLKTAKGEFIAIFDADFIPQKDFLLKTMPYFEDPNVGLVQTRWGHINRNYSYFTSVQAMILDNHFAIEQVARNASGCFINFNGTAGVFRKKCIIDAGNWEDDTLSEDIDISYRAQLKKWKFVFLRDVVCPAELPVQINAFKSQQFRWASGTFQCAFKLLPEVMHSKLSIMTKFQSIMHLTSYLIYPLIFLWGVLSIPIILINKSYHPFLLLSHFTWIYMIAFWSPIILSVYSQMELCENPWQKLIALPGALIVNFGVSLSNTAAIVKVLLRRKTPFVRTPKFMIEKRHDKWHNKLYKITFDKMVIFEFVMCVYCLLAIRIAFDKGSFMIIPFLMLYAIGLFYVFIFSLFDNIVKEKPKRS
jgi:cellulose synthase/poly-beta-1,6-N-acetylglucosamine synthase-like glycosyltransferase